MSLNLDPEVERMVCERAAAEGVSVRDLLMRTFSAARGVTDAEQRVRTLVAQWHAEDTTGTGPTPEPDGGAPGEALFARWREQDATEDERGAEDRLWTDVERGIDETRALLGMRPLSR